jgi:hypothetical protein
VIPRSVGRPKQCPDIIVGVVISMNLDGRSLSEIARAMNVAGYKTPGGRDAWNRRIVFDLLHTKHAQEYIERVMCL